MVSVSNSLGSSAYTRSAQLGGSQRAEAQPRDKSALTESLQGTAGVKAPGRTDLPEDAKAASNDDRRFRDNPKEETAQAATLRTEAQRGSLLDLAV